MNIKSIETHYDGYRFRSRAEARWAVFFNAAKIKYIYEPEGFILSTNDAYLPDFYLPDSKEYFEVKPADDSDLSKPIQFIKDTDKPLVIGYADFTFQAPYHYGDGHYSGVGDKKGSCLYKCVYCHNFFFLDDSSIWDCSGCGKWDEGHDRIISGELHVREDASTASTILNAVKIAKSARFEHGESPNI